MVRLTTRSPVASSSRLHLVAGTQLLTRVDAAVLPAQSFTPGDRTRAPGCRLGIPQTRTSSSLADGFSMG